MTTSRRRTRPVSSSGRPYTAAEVGIMRLFAMSCGVFVVITTVLEVLSWFYGGDFSYLSMTVLPAVIGLLCAAGLSNRPPAVPSRTEPVTRPASDLRTRRVHHHGPLVGSRSTSAPTSGGAGTVYGAAVTTWQEAEVSAARWMRANGYPDAHLTPNGPDGGVDVVASGAIGQVKFTGSAVGPRFIERLAGTTLRAQYRGRSALFFSAAGYTAPALQAGRELKVQLYQLRGSRQWVRVD